MGEYAEMMLDGTLCEACGAFIDDAGGDGVPRYCSNQCARDRGATYALPNPVSMPNPKKTNCRVCGKRLKITGLADHMRDVHADGNRRDYNSSEQAMIEAGDTPAAKVAWHTRTGR